MISQGVYRERGAKVILSIQRVGKRYKNGFWGIKEIDLELNHGVFGLLGPNGAGKTSLLRIIATITQPTTGKIVWNDTDICKNPQQIRKVLGYLPQDFGVYPNLSPIEFLEYMAAIKGIYGSAARSRIDELIHQLNLVDVQKRPISKISGGMKQRVGIAQALLNNPKVLVVDEPTVGLDPEERIRFRNLLSDLAGDRIVIFSTHIVSDIEAIAVKIAILSQGSLLIQAPPEVLLGELLGKVWELVVPGSEFQSLQQKWIVSGTVRTADGVRVRIVSDNSPGNGAYNVEPTLEDAYLHTISEHKVGMKA